MPRAPKANADLAAIGKRIRELRGDERQDDFAPKLGITQGQLSKIERGRLEPGVEVLIRLSALRCTPIDWILTGRGS
jgi:transcriptional regulator with XRE-family HTH domain